MHPLHPLHPRSLRPRLAAAAAVAAALLAGCMGIDIQSVQRIDAAATAQPAAGQAVVRGRIRHLVDGQPMAYGLLDKPHLSLYHHQRNVLMSSPETAADGSYRWQLPPGDYTVAVLFGGMSPARQPLRLPSGSVIRVNGIVDPGAAFTLAPGSELDLGTLVVDVESRPLTGTLFGGGPVFGRLRGLRVEPGTAGGTAAAAPGWVLAQAPAGSAAAAARVERTERSVDPAVLAPLLPLLIR